MRPHSDLSMMIASLGLLIISNFASAQSPVLAPLGGESLVNTTTTGDQWAYFWSVRTVAVQPDGSFIQVWIDRSGLDGQEIGRVHV